jgi:hypothetical protein
MRASWELSKFKPIFDPNEKTKAGKVLPKAYLKAARRVVHTLREHLEDDGGGDIAKRCQGGHQGGSSWAETRAAEADFFYISSLF